MSEFQLPAIDNLFCFAFFKVVPTIMKAIYYDKSTNFYRIE